ncbi:MAG: anion permease [Cardiobacteriaceae bacterium]|nr:anion permease [Cardiobacteriaceae bacterium]
MSTSKNHFLCHFNTYAAAMLFAVVALFIYWGLGYTFYNAPFVFMLAALFGLFMGFNIGGNDVANSFGTSVGAGTLSIPQALAVAAVFEVSGALIAGGEVTNTIRSGIVDLDAMPIAPMEFVYIMMSALIAAAAWLLFATKKGWPVSTTHSIIGAIVGASLALGIMLEASDPFGIVQWGQIGQIAVSWVLSPVMGGLMSFAIFSLIKKHILMHGDIAEHGTYARRVRAMRPQKRGERPQPVVHQKLSERLVLLYAMLRGETAQDIQENPEERDIARRVLRVYMPLLAAIAAMIISYMVIFKGLKNLNLDLSHSQYALIFAAIGLGMWFVAYRVAKRFRSYEISRATYVMFSWMQVLTASCFAFSHGSNDIANAIGPFAAILDVLRTGSVQASAVIPFPALLAFGVALIAGLWFIGKEVIATVGTHLAEMSPASGFTAELAAALVVLVASSFGLPVSSTHILIGAVLGIGVVNRNANWQLMKPIALAWIITIPAAAIVSAAACLVFLLVF